MIISLRQTMPTQAASAWHSALHDPALQDLPYKVETNASGQIILSPHKPRHSLLQSRLVVQLARSGPSGGEPSVEFAVQTEDGVKVPDVVWISDERRREIPDDAEASPVAPEICVEVLSEGNTAAEMEAKRELYLRHGAVEVWTCSSEGRLRFFDANGEREQSALAPDVPAAVDASS